MYVYVRNPVSFKQYASLKLKCIWETSIVSGPDSYPVFWMFPDPDPFLQISLDPDAMQNCKQKQL